MDSQSSGPSNFLCLAHGTIFSRFLPCRICLFLGIKQLNDRAWRRSGRIQEAPLIDLEYDSENGSYSPLLLEGVVDVWEYLRRFPEEREALNIPSDYSDSWSTPYCDLQILNIRIPERPRALMPPPAISTPSPSLSPPESPILRRIYTLQPEPGS